MTDEVIEENAAVTTGREFLDATQNAVINAVENVSEIIETKEEKTIETVVEKIIEYKEPFYAETEFWVAMAFCLFVVGLFVPISKVIKAILKKKINSVVKRIDGAINLRDEAQKLLADYERKLNSAKYESEKILQEMSKHIDIDKKDKLQKMEAELKQQTSMVENKLYISANSVKKEISEMICDMVINDVKQICKNKITTEKQDNMIENSINLLDKLGGKKS